MSRIFSVLIVLLLAALYLYGVFYTVSFMALHQPWHYYGRPPLEVRALELFEQVLDVLPAAMVVAVALVFRFRERLFRLGLLVALPGVLLWLRRIWIAYSAGYIGLGGLLMQFCCMAIFLLAPAILAVLLKRFSSSQRFDRWRTAARKPA